MTFPFMLTLIFCLTIGATLVGLGLSMYSEMRKERGKLRSEEL